MITGRAFSWTVLFCLALTTSSFARERLLMDANWRFTLNDPTDAGKIFDYPELAHLDKAQRDDAQREAVLTTQRSDPATNNLGSAVSFVQNSFDDTAWRQLDLPHDWAVELPFAQNANNGHGSHAIGPGDLGNTIGWYRRHFDLPATDKGQALWIEFDGVYRNSLVWLNGHCLGRNVSGYCSFFYDISKFANYGGANELVVRVDATRTEGWFYEGAGIYRHVWLVKTDPVHVAHWGTYITTNVVGDNAVVTARASVRNDSDAPVECEVTQTILDADGKTVNQAIQPHVKIAAGEEKEVALNLPVYSAKRWSIETPYLYQVVTTIQHDGQLADSYPTTFGIRTIRFDANLGFFLNDKHVEIQGTCNHQDHAGVGSALPDALQYYRIEKLKEMGSNAYRTSHNNPTPELLDACDSLGMLVMDEHRQMGTTPEHLSQLTRLIERDRNHPSVFIWSIGNEEGGIQGNALGASIAKTMQDLVHTLDPTRPCTVAMNGAWGTGISTVIDVQGYNYVRNGERGTRPPTFAQFTGMDKFHAAFPDKPSLATEEASTLSTRGEYANDRANSFESAYDVNNPGWGSTAEEWWKYYTARPFAAGGFVWTGFDYRGEPTPYRWPAVSSQFGIMDTCGFPKDNFFYYQSVWTTKPMVHILPHWNWPGKEGQPIDVWAYSNQESVELFLNGQSLGKQAMPDKGHISWKVPYAPGTLEARAYRGDELAASDRVETAGAPAKIILTPDRTTISADGRDISIINVAVADAQGRIVPTADNLIKFSAGSNAHIVGVGNGAPASHEPDKASERKAFNGLCQVIVQTTAQPGDIKFTAMGEGLEAATVTISSQASQGLPVVP
jgi:beta-galactosidase